MKKILVLLLLLSNLTYGYDANDQTVYKRVLVDNIKSQCYISEINIDNAVHQYLFVGDLGANKPIVFFIPGSANMPLFIKGYSKNNYFIYDTSLFNNDNYNYVLSTKRGVPISMAYKFLNNIDSCNEVDLKKVMYKNDLQSETKKIGQIVSHVRNHCGNVSKVILMGHSQGARIALNTALQKQNNISALVYLSSDPLGRLFPLLNNSDNKYNIDMERVYNPKLTDSTFLMESYESWKSYAEIILLRFTELKIPVFVGFGEKDTKCQSCLSFNILKMNNRLDNMTIKKYANMDHNFFEVEGDKKSKHNNWRSVFKDVFYWLEKKENN